MKIASRVLRYGRSPLSGVTYTREALEEALEKQKGSENPLLGQLINDNNVNSNGFDLTMVATKVTNMWLDDEGLVVEQEVLDTPMGKELSKIVTELEGDDETIRELVTMQITPLMTGVLDNGYNATDLRLLSISIKPIVKE